jgi:predicted AAA+ superfamily ATPase
MDIFQENQHNKLFNIPIYNSSNNYLQKITKLLNTDRVVILSWLHNSWKSAFIKDLLVKTQLKDKSFIFNNDIVINEVFTWEKLIYKLNDTLKYNKNIKIIVLNNFNKIKNIKDFIQYIHSHKNNFKIILIWNSIKIPWVKELEFLSNSVYDLEKNKDINLNNIISHGTLAEISSLNHDYFSEQFLDLTVNEMYIKEIFVTFWVKDIELYKFTMTYLAKIYNCLSLRELQKWLIQIQQITLKTTIDYINFSIRAKIIKPIARYDFKKEKIISSRIKYYFTDTWIRNSISKYSLNTIQLKENLLFQELEYRWYNIYSGLNGTFDFSFYCQKWDNNLCIHYSQVNEKNELKKEINKLNKVPVSWKKYLIVDSIEYFWIKKFEYDNVEIVEYQHIFKKLQEK